jgi:N-acetyltransferase 10
LVSVFDFVLRGLKALTFQEHLDYSITCDGSSGQEHVKCIVAVELHRNHRQSNKYVRPDQPDKISSAELLAIDEAVAIPLPTVRVLMGDRLTFLSSTVNGYEGTGRSLSLKLLKELRDSKRRTTDETVTYAASAISGPKSNKGGEKVHERRWAAAAQAAAKILEGSGMSGSLQEN